MRCIETFCENCGAPMTIITNHNKTKTYHCGRCMKLLQKQMGYKLIEEKTTGDIYKDAEHNTKRLREFIEIDNKKKILNIFLEEGVIVDKKALDRFAKISTIDGLNKTKLLINDICKCESCKYVKIITHERVMNHIKNHPITI